MNFLNIIATFCLLLTMIAMCHNVCIAEELDVVVKDGESWVTAKGELVKIDMSPVKGQWEEHALKLKDGEIVILIGEKVGELQDKVGAKLSVSGILKPRMVYAGTPTRTVEVRDFQKSTD